MAVPVSNIPSKEEREAFLWMQGRLVDLLLRHYAPHFNRLFGEQEGLLETTDHPALAHWGRLAVLFYLREELFENILPRIKRKLSFVAPQERRVEELPGRGRVDWVRTAAANWQEYPDEPPLRVHTVQRHRQFATPENLLAVITLQEYRAAAHLLLDYEATQNSTQAVRHPLGEIADRCTRELVFLQFAELVEQGERIRQGRHPTLSVQDLEEEVKRHLVHNYSPAYDQLLTWRRKLVSLKLLERLVEADPQPMLGADPDRDNYLYQLWLFYEMGELIGQQGRVIEWNYQEMWLTYRWEDGSEYRLQHDQTIKSQPQYWSYGPGVRPDFYIERVGRQGIYDEAGKLVWREPGYVLDAKYYKPRDSLRAPSSPLKRMIADLQLTSERFGALLFAFQQSHLQPTTTDVAGIDEADAETLRLTQQNSGVARLYQVAPQSQLAQYIQPDLQIVVWRVQPQLNDTRQGLGVALMTLLETVHQALKTPLEVRCRGVFLDSLSANAHGQLSNLNELYQRTGQSWLSNTTLDDLVLCPKPHVAPWRVDLVSREHDCCQNSQLCHIKNQLNVQPPQRLTALEEIKGAIRAVTNKDQSDEEAVIQAATRQVTLITRRYADLIKPDMGKYLRLLRKNLDIDDLFETSTLLSPSRRETLALAGFLADQIEAINAQNYAGPVLLYTGTLEEIVRETIYRINGPLRDRYNKALMETLGTLGNCKGYGGANWLALEQNIVQRRYWNSNIAPGQTLSFSRWIDTIGSIAKIRNDAAHTANIAPATYQDTVTWLFGSVSKGMGLLNGLLLAWTD
jgi:hypothetical protein